jgi:hypothetical protein
MLISYVSVPVLDSNNNRVGYTRVKLEDYMHGLQLTNLSNLLQDVSIRTK